MERAGSREKINSASLGGLGGKREKNSQRPGRDQLLRCESFRPLAALRARARNTQQHTATDAARQPARAALSPIAALPVALGFAMPAKPEAPIFCCNGQVGGRMGVVFRGPDGSGMQQAFPIFPHSRGDNFSLFEFSIVLFTPITSCDVEASESNLTSSHGTLKSLSQSPEFALETLG